MKLKKGQFGFWLLVFVGYCGEVPVSLVRKMDGYYDYNRRVVTRLVQEDIAVRRFWYARWMRCIRRISIRLRK